MILVASGALGLLGLYWIARAFVVDGKLQFGNPTNELALYRDNAEGGAFPLQVRAEVTLVEGDIGVRLGDKCEFLVERRVFDDRTLYCNAQVVCGSRLVYGGPDRGYFTCRLFDSPKRGVMGSDPNTTGSDQDAAIHLDTRSGVLRIWDDAHGLLGAFKLEAEVLSVQ